MPAPSHIVLHCTSIAPPTLSLSLSFSHTHTHTHTLFTLPLNISLHSGTASLPSEAAVGDNIAKLLAADYNNTGKEERYMHCALHICVNTIFQLTVIMSGTAQRIVTKRHARQAPLSSPI